MSFQLTFLEPTDSKTVAIDWLEVQSHTGNLVVLEGHAPAYIIIKPNSTAQWLLTSGVVESMKIAAGFLEVGRDRALLIL